jgi:hypothetical protein
MTVIDFLPRKDNEFQVWTNNFVSYLAQIYPQIEFPPNVYLVGDVSPKHHIAARQFCPCLRTAICVAKRFGIRLPAQHKFESAIADANFRRKVAHLVC